MGKLTGIPHRLAGLTPRLAPATMQMVERKRGSAGVAQRRRRLDGEPLCRECLKHDRVTLATKWDHIVPLVLGGTDDDANGQPLCKPCHDAKSLIDGSR